jgi:hypothetical protein
MHKDLASESRNKYSGAPPSARPTPGFHPGYARCWRRWLCRSRWTG